MRTHYLLFLCLLFCLPLSAQIQRGDQMITTQSRITINNIIGSDLTANSNLSFLSVPAENVSIMALALDYRFAISNRFLVGASAGFIARFGEFGESAAVLAPNLRYYFVNQANRGAFLDFSGGRSFMNSEEGTNFLRAGLGYQVEPVPGILMGPELYYSAVEGENTVGLQLQLNFLLGRNNRPETPVLASFERGSIMVGIDPFTVGISESTQAMSGKLSVYRFSSDRFALGGVLGANFSGFSSNFNGVNVNSTNLNLELRARNYFNTEKRLATFSELGAGVQGQFSKIDIPNTVTETNTEYLLSFSGAVGGQVFLRENLALEAGPVLQLLAGEEDSSFLLYLNMGFRWRLR